MQTVAAQNGHHVSLSELRIESAPFRHMVVDGLWDDDLLKAVRAEFPPETDGRWKRYRVAQTEEKLEGPEVMFGPATRSLVHEMQALAPDFSAKFDLPADIVVSTEGGGYHQTNPGGGLAVHADFNRSKSGLYRRLNVIVYLNRDDEPLDGGDLELWDAAGPVARAVPGWNRTLIFECGDESFHGHPRALGPRSPRRSFAAYFFSITPPPIFVGEHGTLWHPRGQRVL